MFGEYDKNIKHIEKSLNLKIHARGKLLHIEGEEAYRAKEIIIDLIDIIREKKILENEEVEAAIRLSNSKNLEIKKTTIKLSKESSFFVFYYILIIYKTIRLIMNKNRIFIKNNMIKAGVIGIGHLG